MSKARTRRVRNADANRDIDAAAADRQPVKMDDLTDLLGFLIRRAQLWVFQDFIKTLGELKLRPAEYAVLSVVGANAGLSQMALSNALGIERAHLARLINRLEDRMLLDRIPSISDRRSFALHLTDHGRDVLAHARTRVAEHEKRLAKRIGLQRYEGIKRAFSTFGSG